MITLGKLTLKNFAVVSQTEITFDRGLSVITGETGAGKSLIVGAISLLVGERGKTEYVRSGASHAFIEGEFHGDLAELRECLATEEIKADGSTLTLTRELFADGRSRCLINDQRANLSTLKKIGEQICDLHGQHQHQWLLDPDRHLWFLDQFGQCDLALNAYTGQLQRYRDLKMRITSLEKQIAEAKEKQDLHQFQLNEINSIAPIAGEEEKLETERRQLENIARIREAIQNAIARLQNGGAAISLTTETLRQLQSIAAAFPPAVGFITELESARIGLSETARGLEEQICRLAENPSRLEEIGERLAQIYKLKRKYGGSIEAVLFYRDTIRSEGRDIDTAELDLAGFKKQITAIQKELVDSALRLQTDRETAAKRLATAMRKELGKLGLPKAQFDVEFVENQSGDLVEHDGRRYHLGESGMMTGQFLFNANVGEDLKPLHKVASGGEISRLMLALKSLNAGNDRVDLLVFDEIDVGIGGETALLVGRKLRELSGEQQLIVITHLQQIASFSDHHFKAIKREKAKRTETEIVPLDQEERVVELGRMISGGTFGEEERRQVEKLLREAGRKVSVDKS
jgi:DNA repair protein RecN (Recombination protein N)